MTEKPHFIKCGPVPVIRDWRSLSGKELTRAERNMRFVEKYLCVPDGDLVGQPIKLARFQQLFFYAVFDNSDVTRFAFLIKARKNAKTATIAMILLCFLIGPEARQNAQIVSGALSKKQAALVFKLASQMIMKSSEITTLIKIIPSQKILIGIPMNVEYQALSAEAGTTHGLSPILSILDEMGQIRGQSNDFLDAVLTSQGAHKEPLCIVISTQAPTDGDWLSIQLDNAEETQNPRIVSHVYEAPADCELDDREAWAAANPALGLFLNLTELEDQSKKAISMPSFESTFRNLHLNQRVNTESPFVSRSVWEENGGEPYPLTGKKVFAGLDLSAVSDLTALVLVSEDGDVRCEFWLPKDGLKDKAKSDRVPYDIWEKQGFLNTTPGAAIEYKYIAYQLRHIFNTYDVHQLNFDRYAMKFLKPWLSEAGFTEEELEKFNDFGQGLVSMSPALRELETKLLQRALKHGKHPILTMCAGNAVVEQDAAGNRKFTKKKSTGRIDGMVSLAMAVDALARYEQEPDKEYKVFFV